MKSIGGATHGNAALPGSGTAAARTAFDDDGYRIGTVSPCGAVIDDGGVRIGVAWQDGDVYDFTGRRIGTCV